MSTTTAHPQVVARSPLVDALINAPGAFYLLTVMAVFLTIWTPSFFSIANLTNVALQVSVLIIISMGMTLVILTEGIDLSLGAVLGLCGVASAALIVAGYPLPMAMLAALLIGCLFGLLNGTLIALMGLPPFIITLGALGIAQGIATVITQGNSIVGLPDYVRWFNYGELLGVPIPIWATVAIFVLTWVLLYRTKFGRYVFAIGGNRDALILSGTRVNVFHVLVYVYAGALAAFASFIMTARSNAAHPLVGIGMEFDAIAAVILGGTSFEKGRGGIIGTVIGALAVGVLRNGMNLVGVGAEWQAAIVGIVIIGAVGLDSVRRLNA